MFSAICVGIGGFIGACLRYCFTIIFPSNWDFPLNTLLINIIGSFIIGVIFAMSENTSYMSPNSKLFLQTGICGGFTTFSTFSLETFNLLEKGNYFLGGLYIITSVLFCLIAVMIGKSLISHFTS